MRDPKIAAFWLFTYPQILGGFAYDDDVKQKIWWAYKVSCFTPLIVARIMVLMFWYQKQWLLYWNAMILSCTIS